MEQQNRKLSGIWYCAYWYPSNEHKGEDVSEYYGKMIQRGNKLTFESLPTPDGSYILVKTTLDDDLVSGAWDESTAPNGSFGGTQYSGVLQAIVSQDGTRMHGKWAGVGQDDGVRKIYTGRWEFRRAGTKA